MACKSKGISIQASIIQFATSQVRIFHLTAGGKAKGLWDFRGWGNLRDNMTLHIRWRTNKCHTDIAS